MSTPDPGRTSWPPPPPPGTPPGPPPPGRPGYPESGQGVLSLVLGILSVVLLPLLGPFAWWLAVSEKRAIAAGRRDPGGRDPASAGRVLGIIGTVLLAVLSALLVAVLVGGVFAGVATWRVLDAVIDAGTVGSRQEWVEAVPRQGGDGYSSGGPDGPDRCSLVGWFEGQLSVGMSTGEVVAAVGDPDVVETGAVPGDEEWQWDLGFCLLDYDVYRLQFTDGRLTDLQYVQG